MFDTEPKTAPTSAAQPTLATTAETAGERRYLTVMFCDLVNSTGIAAQLDAEEWRDLVGAYLDAGSAAVMGMGGHVAEPSGKHKRLAKVGLYFEPSVRRNRFLGFARGTVQRKLDYLLKVRAVERVNRSHYRLGETSLQETAHVPGIVNVVHAACAALSKMGTK